MKIIDGHMHTKGAPYGFHRPRFGNPSNPTVTPWPETPLRSVADVDLTSLSTAALERKYSWLSGSS